MTTIYQPFLKKEVELDDWVREIIDFHFHPQTGSRYWLEKEKELGINARKDIHSFEDLQIFGLTDIDDLRKNSIEHLIPRELLNNKAGLNVYDTGGTTGDPGRIAVKEYWKLQAEWTHYACQLHGFPQEANWAWIGPTGPHVVGDLLRNLARHSNGVCFLIDVDSRWVKKMINAGMNDAVEMYREHIKKQAFTILRTQNVKVFSTTPALLETFYPDLAAEGFEFQGLLYGGTHVSPDTHKIFREETFKNVPQNSGYGNTIMGNAMLKPWKPGDGYDLHFYPLFPMFLMRVVDPNNWRREVNYGETGRVMFTTMSREIFLPNVLERDEGERIGPCDYFGWDGIANVRPFSQIASKTIEGVY